MKKERREDSFIKNPYFKGGNKEMRDFIYANLKYPKSVLDGRVEGEVKLKYSIDHHGNVIDVRIIGGLDEACNAEAVRVVKLLKFVVPPNPKKLRITFHKNITIHFKLKKSNQVSQKEPIVTTQQQIQYTVISTSNTEKPKEQKSTGSTYNYTITIKSSHPTS